MPTHLERIFSRPESLNDLQRRVLAVGLDSQHASAGRETAREWRENLLGLESGGHARAPRLRSENEVVVLEGAPRFGNHRIEQELLIIPIDDQHGWPYVDRIAGRRAWFVLPSVGKRCGKFLDLFSILVRGVSDQPHFLPVQSRRRLYIAWHESRRLGVVQV